MQLLSRRVSPPFLALVMSAILAAACTSTDTRKQQHLEQGNQYSEAGEHRQAIIEYRKAVQLDERFGEPRYRLARAYQDVGDMGQALREMVRAADLLPADNDAQLQAGRLLMFTGQFEDAASRARTVVERDPSNVEALVLLGNAGAGLKDSDKTVAVLEQAIKQLPSEPRLQTSMAALQARRGNNEAAESAFARAIEIAPQSVEARQALSTYYWSTGRTADAERTLTEALSIDSERDAISRDLAILYFMEGRDEQAEAHLVKLVAKFPKEVPLRLALGDLYMRVRRFDDAIKVYEPLMSEPDIFPSAMARMAHADYEAQRAPLAYSRLSDAIKQAPMSSDLHTMLARLLLADKKPREAEAAARMALQVTPERLQTMYLLGSALVDQGKADEALPLLQQTAAAAPYASGPKMQLGRIYLSRGDAKSALMFARDAVTVAPNQALPRLLLVRVLVAQRDAAGAAEALGPLLKAFSKSAEVQAAAGDVAFVNGDPETARHAYTQALNMNPALAEALNGMAAVQLSAGKTAEALSLARKSVAAYPNDARVLISAARTHLAAKDAPQAEVLLQQAIKISPSSLEAYGLLAGLYFQQERLDEARAQFELVARQQPAAVGPATMLGIVLQLQGKPKEAEAIYERLLQTSPNAPVAANNLAMLLLESGGNLDLALNHAQTARKALPNDADITDTLGLVYLKKGLSSLAVTAFEQSTTLQPRQPEFWLHLGQAHAAMGNKVKARAALEQALKLNPEFAGAEEARRALEGLDKRARSSGGSQPVG